MMNASKVIRKNLFSYSDEFYFYQWIKEVYWNNSAQPAHRPHQEEEPTGSPTCRPLYLASVCSTNCLNIFYLIETFILILQSKIQYRNSKVQKEVSLIWTSCNNSNYSLLLWASICWWLVAGILTDAPLVIRKQDFIWEEKFLISNFEFWCEQPGGT